MVSFHYKTVLYSMVLTKRADVLRVESRTRRGKPRLKWEDRVKRGLAVLEGERRTRARARG